MSSRPSRKRQFVPSPLGQALLDAWGPGRYVLDVDAEGCHWMARVEEGQGVYAESGALVHPEIDELIDEAIGPRRHP